MSITPKGDLEYPEKEASDVAVDTAIKLATSPVSTVALAMVGSLRTTIEERRADFFQRLAAKVNEHESRLSDLEAGAKHASATYQMYSAFLTTHDEDKKKALVNAAANVLLNPPDSELEENEFLEFVGLPSFNVYHVRLLRLFCTEDKSPEQFSAGGSLMGRIKTHRAKCGLGASEAAVRKAWDDLTSRKFLDGGGLTTFMSGSGVAAKRTTALGDRFLAFIDK